MKPIVPGLPVTRVKTYWWKGHANFGDALAPYLLEHFTGVELEHGKIDEASIVTIGSVLEHIPEGWIGYICGAGFLKDGSKLKTNYAIILALRGPLTARGIKGNYALGDPGLLADELVGPQNKRWDLGLVPHWKDKELVPKFQRMFKNSKAELRVIDPRDRPLKVVQEIGASRRVVTSSLHGMIVADAFGIPRRVELADCLLNETEGGDFKFRDYSGSIGVKFEPGVMIEPSRWGVEDAKHAIFDAFKVLEKEMADDQPIS